MATLLQQAKKLKRQAHTWNKKASKQDIELVLAWVNDEVSIAQVAKIYGTKGGAIYCKLSNVLKQYIINKKINR